jgi:hypothetical protein
MRPIIVKISRTDAEDERTITETSPSMISLRQLHQMLLDRVHLLATKCLLQIVLRQAMLREPDPDPLASPRGPSVPVIPVETITARKRLTPQV